MNPDLFKDTYTYAYEDVKSVMDTWANDLEPDFEKINLNTKQLINSLEGETKEYVERVEKEQEEKYGNYDVFEAVVRPYAIDVVIGESYITLYFDKEGNVKDTIGTAQGSEHEKMLKQIAKELFNLVRTNL